MKIPAAVPVVNKDGKTLRLELDSATGEIELGLPLVLGQIRVRPDDLRSALDKITEINAAVSRAGAPGDAA